MRIGLITDLSGPMAFWGQATKSGAMLAINDLKAEGIPVELILGDHQLKPQQAVSETTKMLSQDAISAIYIEFTPTAIAAGPLLAKEGIPTLYSAAAVSPLKLGNNIFKTYLDYAESCTQAAQFLKKRGVKRTAILKASHEFGELCWQALKTVYPAAVVQEYNIGDDIRTQVLALKRDEVEAIFNPTFTPEFWRMLRALHDIKFSPLLVANDDAVDRRAIQELPYLSETIFTFSLPKSSEEFLARLHSSSMEMPTSNFTPINLGYLHTMQLARALWECQGARICTIDKLAASPAQQGFGFLGFKNHIAQFNVSITKPQIDAPAH